MPEHDITKLPKWAQDRIEVSERNVAYWKAQAIIGPDGSNTFVRRGQLERPLGGSPVIKFQLGDDWRGFIEAYIEDGHLYVRGGEAIVVRPQAGNVVHVVLSPL